MAALGIGCSEDCFNAANAAVVKILLAENSLLLCKGFNAANAAVVKISFLQDFFLTKFCFNAANAAVVKIKSFNDFYVGAYAFQCRECSSCENLFGIFAGEDGVVVSMPRMQQL